jgi:hypothetical protein
MVFEMCRDAVREVLGWRCVLTERCARGPAADERRKASDMRGSLCRELVGVNGVERYSTVFTQSTETEGQRKDFVKGQAAGSPGDTKWPRICTRRE